MQAELDRGQNRRQWRPQAAAMDHPERTGHSRLETTGTGLQPAICGALTPSRQGTATGPQERPSLVHPASGKTTDFSRYRRGTIGTGWLGRAGPTSHSAVAAAAEPEEAATTKIQFGYPTDSTQATQCHVCSFASASLADSTTTYPTYQPDCLQPHRCSAGADGGGGVRRGNTAHD